jgi:hypothetical protein
MAVPSSALAVLDANFSTDELYAHFMYVLLPSGEWKQSNCGSYFVLHCRWCHDAQEKAAREDKVLNIKEIMKRHKQCSRHLNGCRYYQDFVRRSQEAAAAAAQESELPLAQVEDDSSTIASTTAGSV